MFIAMNRFQVKKGCEHDFEHVWLSRDTYLDTVPGFIEFHPLKGPERGDHVLSPTKTSTPGPSQSSFARRTPAPEATNRSIWGTPNSKGFTSCRPSPKTVSSASLPSSAGHADPHPAT
jgi:Antibiotic biosynthesis monooxygenase